MLLFSAAVTSAYAIYPNLLINPSNASYLTIYNASTNIANLRGGLVWFSIGLVLMLSYVTVMYKSFWGKVSTEESADGYR